MQVTETVSEGLKRELKVVIGSSELDARLNTKLDELKDKVQLKGFRPGKVPVDHIRKVYGRSAFAEVLQETIDETSVKALEGRDERPAFRPAISFFEEETVLERVMNNKADLEYTMSFEVLPKIQLAELKTLKVEKPVAEVSAEEIDKALSRLQENYVNYDAKEGAAEDGDRVTADFVGKIEGEPFEGGSATDAHVVLGRHMFIPGFEEGLMGVKAGDERNIEATFPESYGAKHLAGKAAVFEVKVKEVGAPKLPEMTDDFAKTLGVDTLDKLKDALRERIGKDYHSASRAKAKRSLLDALDEAHKFDLPPSLVSNEFDSIWGEVTHHMQEAKKTFADEGTTEEKAREDYQAMAERRVRLGLVLSEIGQTNSVTVTDEEVRRAVMQKASQFSGQERKVVEFYNKNPGAMLELRAPIFEDKVVDFVLELADVTVKTVTVEELFKADDDEEGAGSVCGVD
jgi:trigger factor